jgi:hypothetical protein
MVSPLKDLWLLLSNNNYRGMMDLKYVKRKVDIEDYDFIVAEVASDYCAFCFSTDPDYVESVADSLIQGMSMEAALKEMGQWKI